MIFAKSCTLKLQQNTACHCNTVETHHNFKDALKFRRQSKGKSGQMIRKSFTKLQSLDYVYDPTILLMRYWDYSQSCSRPFVGWHFPRWPVLFHSRQLPFCKGGIMHLSLTTCLRNLCGKDVNKAILSIHRRFHSSLCICSKPAHKGRKYNRWVDKLIKHKQ